VVQVGILYDDFSITWLPFERRHELKRDGVLAVAVTTERGNRKALVKRLYRRKFSETYGIETDYFAIGVDGSAFFGDQWDDYDEHLRYRSQLKPHDEPTIIRRPRPFPAGADVIVFTGQYVSTEKWQAATAKMDKELF